MGIGLSELIALSWVTLWFSRRRRNTELTSATFSRNVPGLDFWVNTTFACGMTGGKRRWDLNMGGTR